MDFTWSNTVCEGATKACHFVLDLVVDRGGKVFLQERPTVWAVQTFPQLFLAQITGVFRHFARNINKSQNKNPTLLPKVYRSARQLYQNSWQCDYKPPLISNEYLRQEGRLKIICTCYIVEQNMYTNLARVYEPQVGCYIFQCVSRYTAQNSTLPQSC